MSEAGHRVRPAKAEHAQLIADLSFQEFADTSLREHPLHDAIDDWQQRRSPIMVATDVESRFLGFARSKPNETGSFSRFEGQVAVLAQVAVVPEARGRGIGGALVERSLKALRLFGYARAFAQIQPSPVTWYEERGARMADPSRRSVRWVNRAAHSE